MNNCLPNFRKPVIPLTEPGDGLPIQCGNPLTNRQNANNLGLEILISGMPCQCLSYWSSCCDVGNLIHNGACVKRWGPLPYHSSPSLKRLVANEGRFNGHYGDDPRNKFTCWDDMVPYYLFIHKGATVCRCWGRHPTFPIVACNGCGWTPWNVSILCMSPSWMLGLGLMNHMIEIE